MGKIPGELEENDFDKMFEMLPPAPPSFMHAVGHLAASFGLAGDPTTEEMCRIPLTAQELEYVEKTLKLAERLHQNNEIEAAWYYLSCAKGVVSYRNGVEEGRYESSDRAAANRVAAEYGKQGSKKRKAINQSKREEVVAALLAQHEAKSFVIRRQLKEAAAKLGPGGGTTFADEKWAHRLIKQTRLLELYESLSARRKP